MYKKILICLIFLILFLDYCFTIFYNNTFFKQQLFYFYR